MIEYAKRKKRFLERLVFNGHKIFIHINLMFFFNLHHNQTQNLHMKTNKILPSSKIHLQEFDRVR